MNRVAINVAIYNLKTAKRKIAKIPKEDQCAEFNED